MERHITIRSCSRLVGAVLIGVALTATAHAQAKSAEKGGAADSWSHLVVSVGNAVALTTSDQQGWRNNGTGFNARVGSGAVPIKIDVTAKGGVSYFDYTFEVTVQASGAAPLLSENGTISKDGGARSFSTTWDQARNPGAIHVHVQIRGGNPDFFTYFVDGVVQAAVPAAAAASEVPKPSAPGGARVIGKVDAAFLSDVSGRVIVDDGTSVYDASLGETLAPGYEIRRESGGSLSVIHMHSQVEYVARCPGKLVIGDDGVSGDIAQRIELNRIPTELDLAPQSLLEGGPNVSTVRDPNANNPSVHPNFSMDEPVSRWVISNGRIGLLEVSRSGSGYTGRINVTGTGWETLRNVTVTTGSVSFDRSSGSGEHYVGQAANGSLTGTFSVEGAGATSWKAVARPPTTTNSRPVTPAPPTPATASASTKAPAVAGGALFGVSVTSTASSVSVGDSVKTRPAVSGGMPPYTYAWFDGARRSTVTSPVVVWKTSTAGNHAYKVVVTDAAGATAQAQTTVEVTGNLDQASRGQETVLFSVDSVAGVSNNPPAKTVFTLSKPGHLSKILTYHWNGGSGSPPGTIGLRNSQTGAMAGRWTAAGSSGYDRTPGATWPLTSSAPPYRYWTVQPNCDLPAGTYEILDSDPATWSYTADTGNRGIAYVLGWLSTGAAWASGTEAKLAVVEDIQPASLVADVGRFRAVASIQPADAWKAYLTEGAAQQLPGVQKSFFGSVAPAAAWSYFFHGAIFVIDPYDKEGAVALFYHPWSDTALLTLWQRIEGRSLLIRMTVVPGDVIRNPAATNLDLVPHWLRRIDTLPPSLALSAASNETLRAFLTMFPAEAADSATPLPNANRDELSKALVNGPLMKTFGAAASLRFLKCLEGVQRFEQDPALAPYRAKIATVQTQLTCGDFSGLAEATETLPETLALLLKLKPQLADFSVVAFTVSPEACQVYLSQPADPKTVLMLWCETREGACRLRRADFISHDISLMLGDKLPVLIDGAPAK